MRGKCAVIDSLCIRDDPSAQLRTIERTLTSRSMDLDVERRQSIHCQLCQTATRVCAESPDRRDHRRRRCRKRRLVADAPGFNGLCVTRCSASSSRCHSAQPYRPSRPRLRPSSGTFYIRKDVGAARAAPTAHILHVYSGLGASWQQGGESGKVLDFFLRKILFLLGTPPGPPH